MCPLWSKWSKLLGDIKITIYYISVLKWKYLTKIVGNNEDIKSLSSHWKINGRNASGISMVLEAKLQNFGTYLKATGPVYELPSSDLSPACSQLASHRTLLGMWSLRKLKMSLHNEYVLAEIMHARGGI